MNKIIKFSLIFTMLFQLRIFAENYDIEKVITEVLKNSLELQAVQSKIQSVESAILQNKKLNNPELELGLENFGIDEIELGISQSIELSKKKNSRSEVIRNELEALKVEAEKIKRDRLTGTLRKILPAVVLKMKLSDIDEMITASEKTIELIHDRLKKGAVNEIDLIRAQLELDLMKMEKNNVHVQLNISLNDLTEYMNLEDYRGKNISYVLPELKTEITVPDIDVITGEISSFELREYDLKEERLNAEINVVESEALPDLNFSLGYKRNNEEKSNSVLLGFSTQLPIFNKNTDASQERSHLINSVRLERSNKKIELISELKVLHSSVLLDENNIITYQEQIIPKIRKIYSKLEEYYNRSSSSVFEVIEVSRELNRLNLELIDLKYNLVLKCLDITEISGINIEFFRDIELKNYINGAE